MSKNEGPDRFSIFAAFVAGGIVGAGITLLLAPCSGRETRDKIKDTSNQARDATVKKATEAQKMAAGVVERGKEKVADTAGNVHAAVEAGKDSFQHRKDELLENVRRA